MTGSIESGDTLRILIAFILLYLKVFTFDSLALSLSDTPPYDTYPAISYALLLYPDADWNSKSYVCPIYPCSFLTNEPSLFVGGCTGFNIPVLFIVLIYEFWA